MKYIIVFEDYSISYTNDENVAREVSEWCMVYDLQNKIQIVADVAWPEDNLLKIERYEP